MTKQQLKAYRFPTSSSYVPSLGKSVPNYEEFVMKSDFDTQQELINELVEALSIANSSLRIVMGSSLNKCSPINVESLVSMTDENIILITKAKGGE